MDLYPPRRNTMSCTFLYWKKSGDQCVGFDSPILERVLVIHRRLLIDPNGSPKYAVLLLGYYVPAVDA